MNEMPVFRSASGFGVAFSIWHKHMRKFLGNGEELFGLMIQPVLWVVLFGVGMKNLMGTAAVGSSGNYIGFMLPGIAAWGALRIPRTSCPVSTTVARSSSHRGARRRSLPVAHRRFFDPPSSTEHHLNHYHLRQRMNSAGSSPIRAGRTFRQQPDNSETEL